MVGGNLDQMEMSTLMDDCVNCGQYQDMTKNTCVEASCLTDGCMNTSASTSFFSLLPNSSVALLDLSMKIEDRYGSHYLSQIALPLYRPPIA